ncbi:hypothetical protein [Rheinheimera sp. 4Y26]|uniref:hypothetical protein n=1 Tax=Rheinheimera sp. 4Y26 TaxID=2977811 RepID=UPI0021B0B948|nr:hypothetical protein [Rheinheimera sp. 4Y26]MCT6698163.1 hypothetical protein [Rheinheimera sp. 4Y26]
MLKNNDKLLVCYRRLFINDENRFFLGTVDEYDNGLVKITGHSFLRDGITGQIAEKSSQATKILSISAGSLIVYLLPDSVDIDKLHFSQQKLKICLTDGQDFSLDLTEKSLRPS